MSGSYFEMVELANGEIALRRCGKENETLITIAFSNKAKDYLNEYYTDIAKVMLDAGLQAVAELVNSNDETEEKKADTETRVYH